MRTYNRLPLNQQIHVANLLTIQGAGGKRVDIERVLKDAQHANITTNKVNVRNMCRRLGIGYTKYTRVNGNKTKPKKTHSRRYTKVFNCGECGTRYKVYIYRETRKKKETTDV